MRYRKLDKDLDYSFGHGKQDFHIDNAEAVGQAVMTRLQLYYAEWFLAPTDGTPWNTQVLGKYTESTRDPVIRNRILNTKNVLQINQYFSIVNRDTRAFAVDVEISTVYGQTSISNLPIDPSQSILNQFSLQFLTNESGNFLTTEDGNVITIA